MDKKDFASQKVLAELGLSENRRLTPEEEATLRRALDPEEDFLFKVRQLYGITEDEVTTDCREENGITVGMIDGIIAQVRILRDRNTDNPEVKEVLKDLADDEDFQWLCDKVSSI